MECASCDICYKAFCEERCIPKILDCGHSVCFDCLRIIFQNQQHCPSCRSTLTKSLDKYPTNFGLMKLSTNLKNITDVRIASSLKEKKLLLESKWKLLTKSIAERTSIQNEITLQIKTIQELLQNNRSNFDTDKAENLMVEIDRNIEKVDDILFNISNPINKDIMRLSQCRDETTFIRDISAALQRKKAFACSLINGLEWKSGEVTFNNGRLNIHSLSSSMHEKDALLLSIADLRKCIKSKDNILPFLQIGNQTIFFTLIEESTLPTLHFIKLCTGEAGHVLKGSKTKVYAYKKNLNGTTNMALQTNPSSTNLFNCSCMISFSKQSDGYDYEHLIIQKKVFKANKGDIILQCMAGSLFISEVPEQMSYKEYFNVVAKLHKDSKINFNDFINKSIEDCGISISFCYNINMSFSISSFIGANLRGRNASSLRSRSSNTSNWVNLGRLNPIATRSHVPQNSPTFGLPRIPLRRHIPDVDA